MKKKFNLAKVASFVMLLTVTAMILVAGTYAKYSSSASGTDATVVANWSFNVNNTNIAQSQTFTFDLFNTAKIMDSDGNAEDDVADGLIAPGTSGAFEFALENTSDVTAEYKIKLERLDSNNIPIEFSFTGEENSWTTDLEKLIETDVMAYKTSKNVTVQWRWAFGDDTVTDATLGEKTVEVKATITATQMNNAENKYTQTVVGNWLYSDISTNYQAVEMDVYAGGIDYGYAPFVHTSYERLQNKKITRIKLPVATVKEISDKYVFTLTVLKEDYMTDYDKTTNLVAEYPIDLTSYIGTLTSTDVKRWITVDLSQYNIFVGEDECLGYASRTDNVMLAYDSGDFGVDYTEYNFVINKNITTKRLPLDVYGVDNYYQGKKISFLGDSISTFSGYTDNGAYNTTLAAQTGSEYGNDGRKGVASVNDTWWMQLVNTTGMEFLVNNSVCGDGVYLKGLERSLQLHNDTGATTVNPEIVIVYFGVNDISRGPGIEHFTTNYPQMIENILDKYDSIEELYVLTHPQYDLGDKELVDMEKIETYNDVIRNLANKSIYDKIHLVDYCKLSGITAENYLDYLDDGIHPNDKGMDLITNAILNSLNNL